jgi:hypothetical protein
MNVRYILFVLFLIICCPFKAQNRNDSIPQTLSGAGVYPTFSLPEFEYIRESEAWLGSENAAGLQYLPIQKISSAEIYFKKDNGKFVNYFQSDNSYEWGALTESFYRLNPKVVFYGKVHYTNFTGKNMGGSVFINPYYNAFDIVEKADDSRGEKSKEDYHLIGAVSAKLSSQWTIGGKLDYEAANYAKYKDLRHTNKLLDLTTTAGVSYSLGEIVDIGIHYFYRRSVESMQIKMYGTLDKAYYSLVSFGSFYGYSEIYGTGGYTDKDESHPTVNQFHGAALQLNLRFSQHWNLFNELSYQSRKGYFGEKSPGTPIFTEHQSDILSYSGTLSYKKQGQHHRLKINAEMEQLENNENIFELKSSSGGGSKDVLYYGNNQVLDRTVSNVKALYTADLGVKNYLPTWTFQAGGDFCNRQQKVSVYPFYRKQNIHYYNGYLSACKNKIIDRKSRYSISLGALYGSGGGILHEDGVFQTPAESQEKPETTDFNLYNEYEYLTASHIRGNIGVNYSRLLNPAVRGYVRANYELTNALGDYFKNQKYTSAFLAVGCVF